MSRTNLQGPKDVRVIEVRLYVYLFHFCLYITAKRVTFVLQISSTLTVGLIETGSSELRKKIGYGNFQASLAAI